MLSPVVGMIFPHPPPPPPRLGFFWGPQSPTGHRKGVSYLEHRFVEMSVYRLNSGQKKNKHRWVQRCLWQFI
jgi:hypothetical protein